MPYYLFKISTPEGIDLVKNLQLVEQFQSFKEAKASARKLRLDNSDTSKSTYKIMLAENQLLAEELLLEKRNKPILMEHER